MTTYTLSNTLRRSSSTEPLSLDQFYLWSESRGNHAFGLTGRAKKVEILWKNAYYLVHPNASIHTSFVNKQELIALMELCGDLVDEDHMRFYVDSPAFQKWKQLYDCVIVYKDFPDTIAPYFSFWVDEPVGTRKVAESDESPQNEELINEMNIPALNHQIAERVIAIQTLDSKLREAQEEMKAQEAKNNELKETYHHYRGKIDRMRQMIDNLRLSEI